MTEKIKNKSLEKLLKIEYQILSEKVYYSRILKVYNYIKI